MLTHAHLAGCETLRDAMRKRGANVTALDLRGNHIRGRGLEALADMLRSSVSLRRLSLEWNSVGTSDDALRRLGDALASNRTLAHLDLRNNRIGPDGAVALARGLQSNRGLLHLGTPLAT